MFGNCWLPNIVTERLINLWVTILGNCAIAGYCALEIATKKTFFHEYLRENEKIFENILECDSGALVL